MKFCLNYDVDKKYKILADELKIQYKDRKHLPDVFEDWPDKIIILVCPSFEELDWDDLRHYNNISYNKLVLALSNYEDIEKAQDYELKWYLDYYINTYFELNSLNAAGAYAAKITYPLFFDLENLKKLNLSLQLRVTPDLAYIGLERGDGLHGQWMRPEDVPLYEPYIDTIEFVPEFTSQEEALFRIYATEKTWPGKLCTIIKRLDHDCLNHSIDEETIKRRLNCRQMCEAKGFCRICDLDCALSTAEAIESYKKRTDPDVVQELIDQEEEDIEDHIYIEEEYDDDEEDDFDLEDFDEEKIYDENLTN